MRFFQRLLSSPASNFLVIAAEQNFRDRPAAEFRGAGVVREVEKEATGGGRQVTGGNRRFATFGLESAERFVHYGIFVAEGAGD